MYNFSFLGIFLSIGFCLVPVSFAAETDSDDEPRVIRASLGKFETAEQSSIPACVEPLAIERINVQIAAFGEKRTLGCSLVEGSLYLESQRVDRYNGKDYVFYRYAAKMKCGLWGTEDIGKIVQFDGENCH